MIIDYEMELATSGGQLFNPADGASEYGAKSYDLKATGRDVMRGDPVMACFRVTDDADCDVGTSYDLEITADDDEAAGNEVSLGKETVVLANLTADTIHYVGPLQMAKIASTNQYLRAKVTGHGTQATAGKLEVWLQKGVDGVDVNDVTPDTP